MKKLVISYARLSVKDIEKDKNIKYSTSIYNQLTNIREFAKRMNIKIDKEFIDDGYSGINFNRPAFEKMKDLIINNKVQIVITKDMSRLGRDFIETAYCISEFLPRNDVRYIAIDDGYDSDSLDDMHKSILVNLKSLINFNHVKEASIKRKQVAQTKTEHGEFIGFMAPYGYKIRKENKVRTLEIDKYSANIVKRIFNEIVNGKSRQEVANELNNENILAPVLYMNMTKNKNKIYYNEWTSAIIYRILRNATYTGVIVKRKSKKENYRQEKRTVIAISDRECVEGLHPAIVSKELFEKANKMIKFVKKHDKNNYAGTFSNLVICGECEKPMFPNKIQKDGEKIFYSFKCNRKQCKNISIRDTKLKSIVTASTTNIINNFVDEDNIYDAIYKDFKQKNNFALGVDNIQREIELHNTNIKNLYLKKSKNEISVEEFIKEKNKETKLKEELKIKIDEINNKNNVDMIKTVILNEYKRFIDSDILIRNYVKEIVEKIIVHKDNTIEIVYKFGISSTKKIKLY